MGSEMCIRDSSGVATVGNRIFSDIIGIGTDEELDTPFYVNSGAEQFFVTGSGSIGIRTSTELENVTINASSSSIVVDGIGVGSTVIVGAADFKNAGPDATRRFMIPPKVSSTQRGNLVGVVAGAMIYNTSNNRLQVFNGSTWKDCFT